MRLRAFSHLSKEIVSYQQAMLKSCIKYSPATRNLSKDETRPAVRCKYRSFVATTRDNRTIPRAPTGLFTLIVLQSRLRRKWTAELHRNHHDVAPEVEAAWLHHRFTQIHPFQDGNGRIARALATLIFVKGLATAGRSRQRTRQIYRRTRGSRPWQSEAARLVLCWAPKAGVRQRSWHSSWLRERHPRQCSHPGNRPAVGSTEMP